MFLVKVDCGAMWSIYVIVGFSQRNSLLDPIRPLVGSRAIRVNVGGLTWRWQQQLH